MIKYYPQSRIKTDLYTRGTAYKLPNGTPYTGRYYLLYDGTAYAGANPTVGTNQQLTPIDQELTTINNSTASPSTQYTLTTAKKSFSNRTNSLDLSNLQLEELTPYYPIPTQSNYQLGYFTRYFAKNTTGPGYVLEISQDDYANVKNGAYNSTNVLYEITTLLWQLVGPLNDKRLSQYQIQGGVYDTNKRVTEARSIGFRGLVEYIGGDYIKFAKITP
jgi:hypothetical protein